MSSTGGSSIPRIQVFRPTMDEFKHFSKYIQHIESQGAHKAGLAKIIPPENWCPRKKGYDNINLVIPSPISQVVTGSQGLYQQLNIQQKRMTVKEFQKLAESNKFKTPSHFDYEDLERKYWKNITYNSPIYGADVSGSLYDDGVEEFNIQSLNTILDMVKDSYEIQIEGVNTAYLYFGMWKTSFAWHTEDMDLYSINYLHFGAPKSWYVVPPEHGRRLERLAAGFFHVSHQGCPAFLRHKMTIISPAILKKYSIPYQKITQEPGEFMITFPFGYHSGFNHGFNCAESTNFALPRWVEYGKRSTHCTCRKDCVKICMDMFVKRFQPEVYERWREGKDYGSHPEDPSRHCAAPPPRKMELAIQNQREERKRLKETQKIKRHPISKPNDTKKLSKLHDRDSDEDTELYDINEEMSCKGPKKQVKKKRSTPKVVKAVSELRNEEENSNEVEMNEEIEVKNVKEESEAENDLEMKEEIDAEDEVEMEEENEVENEQQVMVEGKNEIKPDVKIKASTKTNGVINENGACTINNQENGRMVKVERPTVIRLENHNGVKNESAHVLKKENQQVTWNSEKEVNGAVIKKESNGILANHMNNEISIITDSPPKLKPFWAPEGLSPIKKNPAYNQITPQVVAQPSFDPQKELLEKYPHLKEAISCGSVTVLAVGPATEEAILPDVEAILPDSGINEDNFKSPIVEKKCTETLSKNKAYSQTWRCEQTSNGLKIKIVQPKRSLKNIPKSSPVASTSVPSTVPASRSPSISEDEFLEVGKESCERKNKIQRTSQTPSPRLKTKRVTKSAKNDQSEKSDSSPNGSINQVERADNSLDSWAHPLKNLWQNQPKNFQAEIEFNQKLAAIPPHCAICVIFTPMYTKTHFPAEPANMPSCSPVRMPNYCYGNSLNSECIMDTNSLLRSDGTAPLLTCASCKVCVHATCYGISMLPMGAWMCTRCSRQATEAECCMCVLRGGALKPTTDNRWAHLICAIVVEESYFENTIQKQPINLVNVPTKRQRLKCKYCFKTALPKESKGICVQCRCGKCYLPYHVTCGYMAGVIFETSDWPEPIHMICTRHAAARKRPPKRELTNVAVGERVIAKHRNKRFYWANVKKKYIQEYYSILFDDNSHSTNTLPEDVVGRNAIIHGPPQLNEKLQIKWTDDKIYNGFFKGSQAVELYVLEFDDGSILHQERKQIYAADEELPKEVQSKMSHSSERHDFITEADGKRISKFNQKYV